MFGQRHKISYYIINGITLYRLASAPILLLLAFIKSYDLFKWLLAFSFFTDAVDGPLARRYNVASVFGSTFDSIADDATVLVATLSLWMIHPEFVRKEWIILTTLWGLFIIQTTAALIVYKRTTSFHTYLAKTAAVAQAVFFIMIFFEFDHASDLFYVASVITALELLEEIILVILMPEWKTNVKGLFWVVRSKRHSPMHDKPT
jgi:CDP-diacylglycerol--glycerol-3-phosphate 3-phosphatidyltransferase